MLESFFALFSLPIANKHSRGVPHATVIQRRHNQIVMGTCPYCQSVTYTGDTICYSCGRILANIRSDKFAMEQQFHRGSLDTTFKMTKKPTKGGVVQTHTGRTVNIMKNRRNRTRHLVLLFFVAFIMLAPQVRENLFEKWAPGIQEYLMLIPAQYHLYDNEATYTLDREVVVFNSNSVGWLYEDIVIPTDVESLYGHDSDFTYTNGDSPSNTTTIQKIESVNLVFSDSSGGAMDVTYYIPGAGMSNSGTIEISLFNLEEVAGFQFEVISSLEDFSLTSPGSGGSAGTAGFDVQTNNGTVLGFSFTGGTIPAGQSSVLTTFTAEWTGADGLFDLEDATLSNSSGQAIDFDYGEYFVIGNLNFGCTDSGACNYDASANADDGSCAEGSDCSDCTDADGDGAASSALSSSLSTTVTERRVLPVTL